MDIPKMKIDLREQPTVKCEKCDSVWFEEVTMIKKVSKLLTGGTEDTIVPFPTYRCADCKHMNEDFNVFE
jgi:DNA-directed RNA polymerase subunit RPC12/RpoP